jgi:prevent-host-death family protein
MQTVNIHEAKTNFSKLVDAASSGEEIVIAKAGKPAARLVPMEKVKVLRRFGAFEGENADWRRFRCATAGRRHCRVRG